MMVLHIQKSWQKTRKIFKTMKNKDKNLFFWKKDSIFIDKRLSS